MGVTSKNGVTTYRCLRCGYVHTEKGIYLELPKKPENTPWIPEDLTTALSPEWTLHYALRRIFPERSAELGIMYSKKFDRVFIPIFEDGKLTYSIVKSFTDPKYIQYGTAEFVLPGNGDRLWLTEDLLSAKALNLAGESAMFLGGTKLSWKGLSKCKDYKSILVWLDPDLAGWTGTYKILKDLISWGYLAKSVTKDAEAKELSSKELTEVISKEI